MTDLTTHDPHAIAADILQDHGLTYLECEDDRDNAIIDALDNHYGVETLPEAEQDRYVAEIVELMCAAEITVTWPTPENAPQSPEKG